MITTAIAVANEIFSEQTVEELDTLKAHFGQAYNEMNLIAELAVKLILRIGGVSVTGSRKITPITNLLGRAEERFPRLGENLRQRDANV